MEQLQTDKINELRRELTLTRASFEQKLNDAENKIREFKKIGEDRRRLIDENKEALTSIAKVQEMTQAKDAYEKMSALRQQHHSQIQS
ncbi:unnamed protein product [Rhizophagus irregularis]|nr:unnamed protein product [Rhizophagus irregularis]